MLYSAPYIITLHRGIIEEGAIRVIDNKIAEAGRRDVLKKKHGTEREIHFDRCVLLPGLINGHAHLEHGGLRSALQPSVSFALWLAHLLRKKEVRELSDLNGAVHLGALECLHTGTTTVFDVTGSGASFQVLASEKIRSLIFLEFYQGSLKTEAEQFSATLARAEGFIASALCSWGVSPHSPYLASPALFRQCLDYAAEQKVPVLTHAVRSSEEWMLFSEGRGPLADFLRGRRGLLAEDETGGPVANMLRNKLLVDNMLLVHGQFVHEEDIPALARARTSVVVCPRSSLKAGTGQLPVVRYLEKGVNVCLGTESLAVSESLDMFEEMYCLKSLIPSLSSEDILVLTILGGAKAFGLSGALGQIRPGFLADVVGVELSHQPGCDLYDEIVQEDHEVRFVLVDGKEVLL
jgi:cytosine/adenosine deaminase-related metal-dependent hydrolase